VYNTKIVTLSMPGPDQPTREVRQEIAEYRESAQKNPEAHLAKLLQHAVAYMKNRHKPYKERKSAYDAQMEQHKKDPTKVKAPIRDPFVVNYEIARELVTRLLKGSGTEAAALVTITDFKTLAEEILKNRLADDVKKEANTIWMRTIMPERNLISNVVTPQGSRVMMFERQSGETAESTLTIYPSGTIEVRINGTVTPKYLPPFPDIFRTHIQNG